MAVCALIALVPMDGASRQADEEATLVQVYFLRDGKVAAARRQIELDPTKQVGRASIMALFDGPNEEERAAGLTTAAAEK